MLSGPEQLSRHFLEHTDKMNKMEGSALEGEV
jgi:hypothetical protein